MMIRSTFLLTGGDRYGQCDPTPVVTYGDVNDLNGCSMTGTITRTWMAEGCLCQYHQLYPDHHRSGCRSTGTHPVRSGSLEHDP